MPTWAVESEDDLPNGTSDGGRKMEKFLKGFVARRPYLRLTPQPNK
ncbi:MAG TPA: hypothetical protein VKQ71_14145 [Acidimicrobiales bacterium]|nr:hypothetical protein [Acidimicrobiales bacterium]